VHCAGDRSTRLKVGKPGPVRNPMPSSHLVPPAQPPRHRAAYAVDPAASRGRLVAEEASPTRSPFQRDRDRIIHSTAFRRLKHKTQVFVEHEGDHYRTRLTHSIEVSQIARSISRALGLDEDLAEALALAHDLGHTPFGHAGERALDRCMAGAGGFDHNAQSLRIVTLLERRYALFDGLNLSWETLEGLVKHNGPLLPAGDLPVPAYVLAYDRQHPLELSLQASAEAQAAAIADDIAYNAHDIDDGLRAGLFRHEDLRAVPFLAALLDEIEARHPGLGGARLTHEVQRRVITRLVEDAIAESAESLGPLSSPEAVRQMGRQVIRFSPVMREADKAIKGFLFPNMYRTPRVKRVMDSAETVVADLFAVFRRDPAQLPEGWRDAADQGDPLLAIADFIAGMTDRFALELHRRMFDVTPELR
jgi:dGTPase